VPGFLVQEYAMKKAELGILFSVIVLVGCSASKPEPKQAKLSPVQIFDLRTKCQQIVDKDVEESSIGAVGNALVSDVKSHYDPATNHCYAEVEVHKNFSYNSPDTPNNYSTIALYDAQTRDLLMIADQKGDQRFGNDFRDGHEKNGYDTNSGTNSSDRVSEEIRRLMTQEQ
jgi:hypothetical protein